jgi:hypothetical protein
MLQCSRRIRDPIKKKWISSMTKISDCHIATLFGIDYYPECISCIMLYIEEKYDSTSEASKQGLDILVQKNLTYCSTAYTNSLILVLEAHGWVNESFNTEGSNFSANVFRTVLKLLYFSQIWKVIRFKERRHTSGHGRSDGMYHDDDNNLALAFVPTILQGLVKSAITSDISSSHTAPNTTSFTGACVLADISGFTKMSAKFCDQGLSGLDDLHRNTSGFLGQYVQVVYAHGGDGK